MNKINLLHHSGHNRVGISRSRRLAAFGVLGALTLAACSSDTTDTDDEPVDPAPVEAEATDEDEADEDEAMEDDAIEEGSVPIVQLQFAVSPNSATRRSTTT
jgi:hypothetical protein